MRNSGFVNFIGYSPHDGPNEKTKNHWFLIGFFSIKRFILTKVANSGGFSDITFFYVCTYIITTRNIFIFKYFLPGCIF